MKPCSAYTAVNHGRVSTVTRLDDVVNELAVSSLTKRLDDSNAEMVNVHK